MIPSGNLDDHQTDTIDDFLMFLDAMKVMIPSGNLDAIESPRTQWLNGGLVRWENHRTKCWICHCHV
jgi:hypothetical protein